MTLTSTPTVRPRGQARRGARRGEDCQGDAVPQRRGAAVGVQVTLRALKPTCVFCTESHVWITTRILWASPTPSSLWPGEAPLGQGLWEGVALARGGGVIQTPRTMFILCGESRMKYTKRRLNDSSASARICSTRFIGTIGMVHPGTLFRSRQRGLPMHSYENRSQIRAL
jgi:hypothetical protein